MTSKRSSGLQVRILNAFVLFLAALTVLIAFAAPAPQAGRAHSAPAQLFAYVTNSGSSSVSVIDTATNTVTATVGVEGRPIGDAFTPDGSRVYVANSGSDSVSVIDTASNTVIATIADPSFPQGLAITPDGSHVYTANSFSNNVAVIDTASNTVIATIAAGSGAAGVAFTPDGSRAYVTNNGTDTVSVIDTATETVIATVVVAIPCVRGEQPRRLRLGDRHGFQRGNCDGGSGPTCCCRYHAERNSCLRDR